LNTALFIEARCRFAEDWSITRRHDFHPRNGNSRPSDGNFRRGTAIAAIDQLACLRNLCGKLPWATT
jgi:hypothetical protein